MSSQAYSHSLLLVVCLSLLCSWAVRPAPTESTRSGAESSETEIAAIDAYVSAAMDDLKIPGVALAIVRGTRIVHLQGLGMADETGRRVTAQTPFRIGSITKSFTALAVMQLVEAGKLELDAPIQRYLPWFRLADAKASAQLTVRHLLNQTSGLSTLTGNAFWESQEGLDILVRRLRTVDLSQPVGARFQYSNLNYSIAGLLIEASSGQVYADYLTRHIFVPLAMHHSHATVASAQADGSAMGHLYSLGRMVADMGAAPPIYQPAGFVSASVEDMAHYAVAQLNGGRYGEHSVLSEKGIAQLHHPAVSVGQMASVLRDTYYGMGWVIGPTDGTPTVWHNGDTGRFHATLILAPKQGLGVVLLANASGLEHLVAVDTIAKGVLNLLTHGPPTASSSTRSLFGLVYWVILFAPLALLLGLASGLRRWWRGDFIALAFQGHRRRNQMWRILWMVIPNLGLALFLAFGLPSMTAFPLSAFRVLYPDLGYALMATTAIGVVWSIVYPALVLLARNSPRRAEQSVFS